jgi:hypothetical protein
MLLIARQLRSWKNERDSWPATLDVIEQEINAEIFVDPYTGNRFLYRTKDEGMELYSAGKDGIDSWPHDGSSGHDIVFDDVTSIPESMLIELESGGAGQLHARRYIGIY